MLRHTQLSETVNRALLTKGNPQGDVLFGIDNNLLSRALELSHDVAGAAGIVPA